MKKPSKDNTKTFYYNKMMKVYWEIKLYDVSMGYNALETLKRSMKIVDKLDAK